MVAKLSLAFGWNMFISEQLDYKICLIKGDNKNLYIFHV